MKPPKMKKIIFYEPQCKGIEHIVFNSSILQIFYNIFGGACAFELYAEADHSRLLAGQVTDIQFKKNTIRIIEHKSKTGIAAGILYEFWTMLRISLATPDYLICLSVTPWTVLFGKNLLRYKNTNIILFFHSMLEALYTRYRFWRYFYWLRPALECKSENCVNIVPGENIQEELRRFVPSVSFEWIDHPYPAVQDIKELSLDGVLKFASTGFGSRKKGTGNFFALDGALCAYRGKIELHYVGQLLEEGIIPDNSGVSIHGGSAPLSPKEFSAYINEMHYCVYCYPAGAYRLTQSGAMLDALTHYKPVIALKNACFEYMFSKMGNIGYLCATMEEIAGVIKKIVDEKDSALYREQQKNIMNGLRYFSLETVEYQVRKIIANKFKTENPKTD